MLLLRVFLFFLFIACILGGIYLIFSQKARKAFVLFLHKYKKEEKEVDKYEKKLEGELNAKEGKQKNKKRK